jgi:hypothetical protein
MSLPDPECSACRLWRSDDNLVLLAHEAVTYRMWFLSALALLVEMKKERDTLSARAQVQTDQIRQLMGLTSGHPEMERPDPYAQDSPSDDFRD